MPATHGKNTVVLLDAFDLTRYFREASTPMSADVAETSTFGSSDKTYIVGMGDATLNLNGLFDGDAGAVDQRLQAILGLDSDAATGYDAYAITVYRQGYSNVGGRASLLAAKLTNYQVNSPVADVVQVTSSFQASGGADEGVALLDPSVSRAFGVLPFTGTAVDNGSATGAIPLTAASAAANVATFTTNQAHGFVAGQTVTVAGVTPAGYNGTWVVLAGGLTATQFTANIGTTPAAGSAFGTVLGTLGGGVGHIHIVANTLNAQPTFAIQHSVDNVTFSNIITVTPPANATPFSIRTVLAPGTLVNRYVRARVSGGAATAGAFQMGAAFARR